MLERGPTKLLLCLCCVCMCVLYMYVCNFVCVCVYVCIIQGCSNMTGTDLCVNKPQCAAAVRP